MKKQFTLISFIFLLMGSVLTAEEEKISVRVRVEGFTDNNGLCRLLIYPHKKGFPDSASETTLSYTSLIKDKSADFFLKLVSGKYAFSILHDANANGKMDKTWYGKPVEGFGTSNNPAPKTNPPVFDECTVKIDNNSRTFFIRINYI